VRSLNGHNAPILPEQDGAVICHDSLHESAITTSLWEVSCTTWHRV